MFSNSFSDIVKLVDENSTKLDIHRTIKRIVEGEEITLLDAQTLLWNFTVDNTELFELVNKVSIYKKKNIYHSDLFCIAPLYVTSFCHNDCTYCNYRRSNKSNEIQRKRLSMPELSREIEYLLNAKNNTIELVYATDPKIDVNVVLKHVDLLRSMLIKYNCEINIGINSKPWNEKEYNLLRDAGLNYIVLWQETYNEKYYSKYHEGSIEKSDFFNRLNSYERAIMANIDTIGLGVLSGLYDWKSDWLMLMYHVHYLLKNYSHRIKNIILGIPRVKDVHGTSFMQNNYYPLDKEFIFAINVFNILFPKSLPFINTRENLSLCLKIAEGGGALFTHYCTTIPGGYTLDSKGYQFPTYDFTSNQIDKTLEDGGMNLIRNWSFNQVLGNR